MERSYRGGSPALPFNYMGMVARATYNYKRRYIAEFNMGYNGSENFKKGNQFGFFPSYSLGYVISEESFFPQNNILTFLKVRGSQGKVGNDRIGGDRFLYTPSAYSRSSSGYRFGESYTTASGRYTEDKIGNPYISWEVATKSNIGLEMKLFSDRVSFAGDLFKEKREGILDNYNNVPFTFGDLRLLPSYNLGIVENKGYEFELGYSSPKGKDLQYWVNANYTFARNKVVYNDEVPPEFDYLKRTGKPIGQPFMLVADGFYNTWEEVNDTTRVPTIWDAAVPVQVGDVRYVDQNNDGIIDGNDQVAVGYSNIPEIVYGITTGVRWKGFDLTILLQGTEHVNTLYGNRTIFAAAIGARTEAAYGAWSQEKYDNGEEILYPRISLSQSGNAFVQNSTLINQDASYIRLKNLELGYTLPKNLTTKFGCSMLRVYFNGQNLATLTKMKYWDPEIVRNSNFQYPVTRIINFGFRANF
jgi:TonB-linked SusC/RagA family outer membrane protein